MWRGLMLTKAVEQFLRDVRWGDLDDLLIDMPPGTGDVQMGLARLLPRADMVIVTTPALAAQKVAQRAADMARRSFVRVVGVVENMTDFTCEHGGTYPLFGAGGGAALADAIGVPLLGQVPLEAAVSAGGDAGAPWRWRPATMPARRRRRSSRSPPRWTTVARAVDAPGRPGHGGLLGPPAGRRRGRPRRPRQSRADASLHPSVSSRSECDRPGGCPRVGHSDGVKHSDGSGEAGVVGVVGEGDADDLAGGVAAQAGLDPFRWRCGVGPRQRVGGR